MPAMREETVDEYDVLTEELTAYEIERGKPMPSMNHSRLQKRFLVALEVFEPVYECLPEIDIELDGKRFTPDVAVYAPMPVDWQNDVIRLHKPPLLAIEILSPKQRLSDLTDKARFYLAHGVHAVWIAQPEFQIIVVLLPNEPPRTFATGDIHDSNTGIKVNVEELFR
jgi:Uma2 family endonuclease